MAETARRRGGGLLDAVVRAPAPGAAADEWDESALLEALRPHLVAFLRAPPPGAGGLPDVTGGRALLAALDLADTPAGRWALLPTAPDLPPHPPVLGRQVRGGREEGPAPGRRVRASGPKASQRRVGRCTIPHGAGAGRPAGGTRRAAHTGGGVVARIRDHSGRPAPGLS